MIVSLLIVGIVVGRYLLLSSKTPTFGVFGKIEMRGKMSGDFDSMLVLPDSGGGGQVVVPPTVTVLALKNGLIYGKRTTKDKFDAQLGGARLPDTFYFEVDSATGNVTYFSDPSFQNEIK